jgi:hypothetical protein
VPDRHDVPVPTPRAITPIAAVRRDTCLSQPVPLRTDLAVMHVFRGPSASTGVMHIRDIIRRASRRIG